MFDRGEKMIRKVGLLLMLLLLALSACTDALPEGATEVLPEMPAMEEFVSEEAEEAEAEHEGSATHAVHWSYEGEGAPENWAELGYNECAGTTQSPIDLASAAPTDLQNIEFAYGDTAVKLLNNGHTIQVDQIENGQININGETYFLKQFHFHAPSEHTLNGQSFPMEMHLVHKTADDSKAAVVGVFIAEGAENPAFVPFWGNLPTEESPYELQADGSKKYTPQDTGATLYLADLLPGEQLVYRYDGSLTTPPCSPNILWSVMQAPIQMSPEQIATFTNIMEGNNRPVQALNERDLQVDTTP
jgi:carbonic anhydrase